MGRRRTHWLVNYIKLRFSFSFNSLPPPILCVSNTANKLLDIRELYDIRCAVCSSRRKTVLITFLLRHSQAILLKHQPYEGMNCRGRQTRHLQQNEKCIKMIFPQREIGYYIFSSGMARRDAQINGIQFNIVYFSGRNILSRFMIHERRRRRRRTLLKIGGPLQP